MSEKYCGSCGGVRIGTNQFCIICGSKFATVEVPKCPTCNQEWPDAPSAQADPHLGVAVSPLPPSSSPQRGILTDTEARLEGALNLLVRPIRWADKHIKGKDCLNCGCPDSAPVCTVCGFTR